MRRRQQPDDMKTLAKAAERSREAERSLHQEIFRAHHGGNSLRAIAEATDVSHETIRVIVAEVAAWAEREREALVRPIPAHTAGERTRIERDHARRRDRLDYLEGVRKPDNT